MMGVPGTGFKAFRYIANTLAIIIGVAAGIIAAVNHNRWPDQLVMTLALFGLSVPDFWLGIMLILLVSVKLGWLPASGYEPFFSDPVRSLETMVMPAQAQ